MDGILISGEVGIGKPNPAIFVEFLARFGLAADQTVFIDDWDRNVATARSLGMIAVQFVDAAQLRTDLRGLSLPLASETAPTE
jgi:2-haloacid dehalogenase